ncbi:Trm112p-like protein [Leishmania donovani]|uniref:Trm112p-like_protein_-_putative n=3 Tax=Leishmania donovani species complex TaxID=38574 RepID=A0A6L0WSC4_LEIIN|nr:conserved hypothetical protein [Leishmania infantum JPCM5]XP_003858325.1 hypothetical protein, conserved [Leishmania donovani]CAC9445251.1 Trm112p-like_protein_-_putative [Leishmania infantum]AYU76046.1 Trm112p-like protein, putative [Leishmania donovani]TPP49812.1 Trm112p-like family protein [Leishmania donovani]TPP54888.1 Trm112p-like family protein [Leishmania donovani]CAJ1986113.1 Trm112p-like protein [Leishmania donovani]|eukprot:XP_001463099.1 conserved hypothetical protein [Leishmania infantum JPCM5]
MRLLTHNFLACLKCDTYPLHVTAAEMEEIPVEYDAEFTRRMLARVDYASLRTTFHALREAHELVRGLSHDEGADTAEAASASSELPETMEGADFSDHSAFLRTVHYAMNVVAVRNGTLECPACKTTFAINDFIPNFVPEAK